MRLLMMGTGPFAVPTFASLLDSEHEGAALVTRPVAPPVGRRKGAANPMRDVADARGVKVLDPEDVNADNVIQRLRDLQADLLVACDYGQILSAETLGVTPLGGINLHASLLPEYRGAAPINWAILDGKRETGVTVIHMTPRLDSGPLLVQVRTEIREAEDAVALEQRLARLGVDAVYQSLAMLATWNRSSPIGEVQDRSRATRAPRLKKTDGRVAWNRTATQIRDQVRALKPWPGTFTDWLRCEGAPVRIILDHVCVVDDPATSDAAPGEIVLVQKDRVLVATGGGLLSIERIQPAGKRVMEIAEFLRGHNVQKGERLGDGESIGA